MLLYLLQEIQIFKHEVFGAIRTMTDEKGEAFFVGKDVAKVLGYSNTRDALNKHVDSEDKGVAKCDTLGGLQNLVLINESGLYSLILSSKLPQAKAFERCSRTYTPTGGQPQEIQWLDIVLNNGLERIAAETVGNGLANLISNPESPADFIVKGDTVRAFLLISCSEQQTRDGETFMANRIKIHQIRKINDYREPPAF